MFSRSFSAARKKSEDDIKSRALVNRSTVRRPPASSGEHNYAYTEDGFRVFKHSQDNYPLNLVADYQHFMKDASKKTTLPYHYAITALHHAQTARTTKTLLSQARILQRLAASAVATTASTAPPNYEDSRHLLDKMKYAIPSHPKTKVVYCNRRIPGFHFDPANVPPERTFVKLCCKELSSADTCRCHVGTSHESVQYTNAVGEQLTVCYFRRKNDYFNTTYRMWGDSSDYEAEGRVPHSPRGDVSDSEIWPYPVDTTFEDKVEEATAAVGSGFHYVWSNKRDQHRFERRQRRSKQLASRELPEYGLILVLSETEEVRRLKPHPIAGYDNERRESYKAEYEKIRDRVHADAIAQAQPQPQPQPESDNLHPSMLQRKFMDIKKSLSTSIERPLGIEMLTVARSVAMLQVTPISALQPHHRIRTVAGSLASLLALHLCCEKTFMLAHVDQKANNYREVHSLHFIHHDAVHHILRRASGSQCRADNIAARYTECASKIWPSVTSTESEKMKKYAETKFAPNIPIPQNSSLHGPRSFHLAKFFARECLKLIGPDADADTTSAKWAKLRTDVLRVRRGELTANQVMVDPGSANDYWVYSIYYTFNRAVKHFLDANTEWSNSVAPKDTIPKRKSNWPGSQEIGVHMPRVIQTALMIREMYRFIIKASPVLSTEFSGVFGYNMNFIKVLIARAKHLATEDGDEASALIFGHFLPCMMTPDVHLDICVEGSVFQYPELYVKMSDRVFGQLKKEQQDVMPSRHTGTIERAIIHR